MGWCVGALLESSSPSRRFCSAAWWCGGSFGRGIAEQDPDTAGRARARRGRLRSGVGEGLCVDQAAGLVEQRGPEAEELGQAFLRLLLGGGLAGRRAPGAAGVVRASADAPAATVMHRRAATQVGLGWSFGQAYEGHGPGVGDAWASLLT